MASFNRGDYRRLFDLGRALYTGEITAKKAGTILMAMSESVIGQQGLWPCIHAQYRHLTKYASSKEEPTNVVEVKFGGNRGNRK